MNPWLNEFGDAFAGRKVLVTGATGFIGRHLGAAVAALGAEVVGLSRGASAASLPEGCAPLAVDLADMEALRAALRETRPCWIWHLAGVVTASQDTALVLPTLHGNLIGDVQLMLAAAETGCERLVCAGSAEEPAAERGECVPGSPYAAAKAASALYARMFHRLYGLPAVWARPFVTYGPGQAAEKLIPHTILALQKGESPRLSSGTRLCDFIYVQDVVRGLLRCALQPELEGERVDLGTGEGTSIRDVVRLLCDLHGGGPAPVFGALPDRVEERPRIADRVATRRLLDWEPQWSLRDGLAETVRWYREKGEEDAKR